MNRKFASWFAAFGLLASLSCGDDPKRQLTDAAPAVDGATDARSPDANVGGIVKVTAILFGSIVPDATVIFQNADGSEISSKKTDVLGQASETMLPGGIVNVVLESPVPTGGPSNTVVSFVEVKPGDVLSTGKLSSIASFLTHDITLPPSGAGSDSITATSECGSAFSLPSNGIGTIGIRDNCTMTDFFVRSRNASGTDVGAFLKKNVAIPAGAITIVGETYKLDKTFKLNINNVPSDIMTLSASALLSDGKTDLFPSSFSSFTPVPVALNNTGTVTIPDVAAPVVQVSINMQQTPSSNFRQDVYDNTAVADYTLDLTGKLLPWITTVPTLDSGTATITWTEASGGVAPEAIIAFASEFRTPPGVSFGRYIIAPYRAGTLKVPRLSGDAAKYDFVASDTPSIGVHMMKAGVGYDAIRGSVGEAATSSVDSRFLGAVTGRLLVSRSN
jgi:hypothetical protein